MVGFTENMLLGAKTPEYLHRVISPQKYPIESLSFWYCYWYFHTDRYTVFIMFHLKNKFSDRMMLNVYLYDFVNKTTQKSQIPLKFKEMAITKTGEGQFTIIHGMNYVQKINMVANTMSIDVKTGDIDCYFEMKIDMYETNDIASIPRYNFINNNIYTLIQTGDKTNHEWLSDNPMVGKIVRGTVNGTEIAAGGNYWFDNFIGINGYTLKEYIWYVILTDEWLIYLLWFGDYRENNGKYGGSTAYFIKDRIKNKMLYCGLGGHTPAVYAPVEAVFHPHRCKYESPMEIGGETYDDYCVEWNSPEIDVKITGIRGESHRVFVYDYYNTDGDVDIKTPEDAEYYRKIQKKYVEYVNMAKVEIEYEGKNTTFVARNVIDVIM
jgi:hypothetical protein